MKKYYSLAVACATMLFISCSKQDVNTPVNNSTSSSNTLISAATPPIKLARNKAVNFGAMICPPSANNWLNFQLNVADQLGVSCLRARTFVPATLPVTILNSNYDIVLNFNSEPKGGAPLPFVTDLTKYQQDLNNTLAKFTKLPAVAVIENEESNIKYYKGTAQEYINQLAVAIPVMHAHGIKVTNAGITSTGLNYLVYQDFLAQGKIDSAKMFQKLTYLVPTSGRTQERGAFVETLLQAYTKMDLDYVNFHWKGTSPDIEALKEVVAYLKKRTGKQVMSNELGQQDKDTNTLLAHMQFFSDSQFAYAIWYSPDENSDHKATPLQHSNESLTTHGITYRDYLKL